MTTDITNKTEDAPEKEKRLLTDEVFTKLRETQQAINYETDITPNLRKLINEIMSDDNINKAKDNLIKRYS